MPVLSSKRQVTLPKALCDRLCVVPGDRLEILEHNGRITILRKRRGASAGLLAHVKADANVSEEESLQDALGEKRPRSAGKRRAA